MTERAPDTRTGRLGRWLREPLGHFLLIGVALFGVYSLVNPGGSASPDEIVVTRAQIDVLAQEFARTWLRPPTEPELSGLIDDYIAEEIYYREALALGLDRDDTVIRRRLRQKMEFISEDIAATRDPTEAELRAYLEQNAAKFTRPSRVSFEQIFFSRERRGDGAEHDAERVLTQLEAGGSVAVAAEAGDATLLPSSLESADAREVASSFGAEFAAELEQAPVGHWSGPLRSAYGLHLVRVGRRDAALLPPLAEIRAEVRSAWEAEQREKTNDELLARLRSRYRIRVER